MYSLEVVTKGTTLRNGKVEGDVVRVIFVVQNDLAAGVIASRSKLQL